MVVHLCEWEEEGGGEGKGRDVGEGRGGERGKG